MPSVLTVLQQNLTNQNMIKHCLASGAVMRGLALRLGLDPEDWEVAGLLHDADAEKSTKETQGAVVGEWLEKIKDQGLKIKDFDGVKHAMAAHNEDNLNIKCESPMDWALFAGEKLTGLIVASALVLPEKKLSAVTPEMVLRRFKEKSFAKGAKRENILECAQLGLSLEEFVTISLTAMQGIAADLGL